MRAWSDVERVLHRIWTLDAGRDDEASVHADTVRTVPPLIELVASSAADVDDRGRAALLLGLIAEGHGAAADDCRAEIRKGMRTYLDALVRNPKREGLVAALFYLLAHFPEDARTILDVLGARFDEGNRAFAQMRRVFEPPSTLRRVGSVEELTASTLAEMGARAVSTLPLVSVTPGDVGELVSAIEELLDDADLRARYSEAGRVRALERFSWHAVAVATAEAYERVITESGKASGKASGKENAC